MNKPVNILWKRDGETATESLSVNGVIVGFGDAWDVHCDQRLEAIEKTLTALGIKFKVKEDPTWRYEE